MQTLPAAVLASSAALVCAQVEAGQLQKAAKLYREALQENPDDWAALQAYLDCRLPASAAPAAAAPAAGQPSEPAGAAVQLADGVAALAVNVAGGANSPDAEVRQHTLAQSLLWLSLCNWILWLWLSRMCMPRHACVSRMVWLPFKFRLVSPTQEVLEEAAALVAELDGRGESASLRGPVLAGVELQRRRLRLAAATAGSDKDADAADTRPLATAIRDAYVRLGATNSCATDLRCDHVAVGFLYAHQRAGSCTCCMLCIILEGPPPC